MPAPFAAYGTFAHPGWLRFATKFAFRVCHAGCPWWPWAMIFKDGIGKRIDVTLQSGKAGTPYPMQVWWQEILILQRKWLRVVRAHTLLCMRSALASGHFLTSLRKLPMLRVPRGYRRSPEFCALHRPVGSLLWETIVGRFTCSNWDIQQANQPTDELSQLIGFCASVAKWWTLRCMMNSLPKWPAGTPHSRMIPMRRMQGLNLWRRKTKFWFTSLCSVNFFLFLVTSLPTFSRTCLRIYFVSTCLLHGDRAYRIDSDSHKVQAKQLRYTICWIPV